MSKKSSPKTRTKAMTSDSVSARRLRGLLGAPLLLAGEDRAAFDELLAGVRAAVKPQDTVDEIFIADVVSLEWEVLRWRRLKYSLVQALQSKALEAYLRQNLDYSLYKQAFVDDLAEILEENLPEGNAVTAGQLAHACAESETDAVDKVNQILTAIGQHLDDILDRAQARKAEEVAQNYMRREPNAVALVDNILADAIMSVDTVTAQALIEDEPRFDHIGQIDRLITIAESRRDASLREIDRRRAVLCETLRRSVREIEDADFKVLETTPAKEKNAA